MYSVSILTIFGTTSESEEPLTNIDTRQIYKTSRLVSNLTGMLVQPNKAVVGANAFAHESGIHQDGVLKNKLTYEIMDAQLIGLTIIRLCWANTLVAMPSNSPEGIGFWAVGNQLNKAFLKFKDLADKKKEISDLIWKRSRMMKSIQPGNISPRVGAGFLRRSFASHRNSHLRTPDGEELTDAAIGTGPVDAVYKAINRVVNVPNQLIEFSVQSVTAGIDAIGEVTIRLRYEERVLPVMRLTQISLSPQPKLMWMPSTGFMRCCRTAIKRKETSPLLPDEAKHLQLTQSLKRREGRGLQRDAE